MLQRRNRKVKPDTSLNHRNQKHRHTRRLKGKQKHHQHGQNRNHIIHQIITAKRLLQVILAHRFPAYQHSSVRIIFLRNLMHPVKESKCLLTLFGKCQKDKHTAVVLTLKLVFRKIHGIIRLVQRILQIILQRDIPFLYLIVDKHKHVYQRHFIFREAVDHLCIVFIVYCIGRIYQLRHLVIQINQLRKLPRRQPVCQTVIVQRLYVGKPLRVIHLWTCLQLFQQLCFFLVVSRRHNQRNHIAGAKIIRLQFLRLLDVVLNRRRDRAVTEHIRTPAGNRVRPYYDKNKEWRHDMSRRIIEFPYKGNVRDEILMSGAIHQLGKQHNNARHQQKHRTKGQENGLNQTDGQIRPHLILHKSHRNQTPYGGQGTAADLRDRFTQGNNNRLAGFQCRMFLLIPVQKDNGIVHRQSKLQHHRHRIGDKGDRSEDEICPHLQNGRCHESNQQNGHFRICL